MQNQLKLKQTQQLQLNPQLQQAIKLLQMSGLELDEAVEQALLENPLLERVESDFSEESHEPEALTSEAESMEFDANGDFEEDWQSLQLTAGLGSTGITYEGEFQDAFAQIEDNSDFRQFLRDQVCEHQLSDAEVFSVRVLIEHLDEHGYLSTSLTEVVEHSPLEWFLEEEQLAAALVKLQRFEPAGVGATDLAEFLLLQLQRMAEDETIVLAKLIVRQYFSVLAQPSNVTKLKKYLPMSAAEIQTAVMLIQTLNPYPSSGYAHAEPTQYVLPDIRVFKKSGKWIAQLQRQSQPQIRVNEEYAAVVEESGHSDLKRQIQEAKQLISGLEMRSDTVLRVADYVVEHQQEFFSQGAIALKPMLIKSVAEFLDLHESTISRAVNQKYLSCPQGLFELRWFFTQTATNSDGDGEDGISNRVIKTILEKLIGEEDKRKPLSDEKLAQKLLEHDIKIARRTVTKYRESLRIASASERKIRS